MITDDERIKRQKAYEIAKVNSIKRGVALTPETEALMKQFINGEISDYVFLTEIQKMFNLAPNLN